MLQTVCHVADLRDGQVGDRPVDPQVRILQHPKRNVVRRYAVASCGARGVGPFADVQVQSALDGRGGQDRERAALHAHAVADDLYVVLIVVEVVLLQMEASVFVVPVGRQREKPVEIEVDCGLELSRQPLHLVLRYAHAVPLALEIALGKAEVGKEGPHQVLCDVWLEHPDRVYRVLDVLPRLDSGQVREEEAAAGEAEMLVHDAAEHR